MEVSVIADVGEIRRLKTDWERLASASGNTNPFSSFAWYRNVLDDHASRDFEPFFIVASDRGSIAAIAPLRFNERRVGPFRLRELVGANGGLADYFTFLIDPKVNELSALKAIFSCLHDHKSDWDLLHLKNVPSNWSCVNCLEIAAVKAGLSGGMAIRSLLALETPAKPSDQILTSKRLRELRRRRKRINQEGHVESRIGKKITDVDWKEFVELCERSDSKKQRFIAGAGDFLQRLIGDPEFEDRVAYSDLRLDGKPIAAFLTFKDESNVYLYMPVFDSDFKTHSPGVLLIADIVDRYADSEVRTLDFLRGAAAYKFDWCSASKVNYDYVTPSPASRIGRVYATIFCARNVLKAFWSTSHQLEA